MRAHALLFDMLQNVRSLNEKARGRPPNSPTLDPSRPSPSHRLATRAARGASDMCGDAAHMTIYTVLPQEHSALHGGTTRSRSTRSQSLCRFQRGPATTGMQRSDGAHEGVHSLVLMQAWQIKRTPSTLQWYCSCSGT